VVEPAVSVGSQEYLKELRGFVLGAVAAARSSWGSDQRLREGGETFQTLRPWGSAATPPPSGDVCTANPEGHVEGVPGTGRVTRPGVPKKRAGASLVDPNARRARRGGTNPFQLSG